MYVIAHNSFALGIQIKKDSAVIHSRSAVPKFNRRVKIYQPVNKAVRRQNKLQLVIKCIRFVVYIKSKRTWSIRAHNIHFYYKQYSITFYGNSWSGFLTTLLILSWAFTSSIAFTMSEKIYFREFIERDFVKSSKNAQERWFIIVILRRQPLFS